jgi:hypothetical protein
MSFDFSMVADPADVEELRRLLGLAFKDDQGAAWKWLTTVSEYWRAKPLDVLRDELGVVRVISYLKEATR